MVIKKTILALLVLSALFLVSCSGNECQQDFDCTKAQCCHATDAISKANAPDCKGIICTAECQPNTLDCGQGEILCQKGKCVADLRP